MNVKWFPFDEQTCDLTFGSWTYNADEVNLVHLHQSPGNNVVESGIGLDDLVPSVEWDLLEIPAKRNMEYYPNEPEPYVYITFQLVLRRKIVFYTVNLILPLAILCFLTIVVFYLPCDSGEKVSLAINILVSISWFFLLLNEISPPTSQAIPLIGRYLLFTAGLVSTSVILAVCVLRMHFRGTFSENMPNWITTVFLHILPTVLCMHRPKYDDRLSFKKGNREDTELYFASSENDTRKSSIYSPLGSNGIPSPPHFGGGTSSSPPPRYSHEVMEAIKCVELIAKNISDSDDQRKGAEDWKYAAMVLDRLFLWTFFLTCVCGLFFMILLAPSLTDRRVAIQTDSEIYKTAPTASPLLFF